MHLPLRLIASLNRDFPQAYRAETRARYRDIEATLLPVWKAASHPRQHRATGECRGGASLFKILKQAFDFISTYFVKSLGHRDLAAQESKPTHPFSGWRIQRSDLHQRLTRLGDNERLAPLPPPQLVGRDESLLREYSRFSCRGPLTKS
jgi:hypothetical protein